MKNKKVIIKVIILIVFGIISIFAKNLLFFLLTSVILVLLEDRDNGFRGRYSREEVLIREICRKVPDFKKDDFYFKAFNLYQELLNCWSSFDRDKIRNIVSVDFYEKICEALEKKEYLKDYISDISLLESKIVGLDVLNSKLEITVNFKFRCIYYVVNTSNDLVMMGSESSKVKESAEVVFLLDLKGGLIIDDKILGMPYFSHNFLENDIRKDISKVDYSKVFKNISMDSLKRRVFEIYKKLMLSLMNGDIDSLGKCMTKQMYYDTQKKLNKLKLKEQRVIYKNITLRDCKIIGVGYDKGAKQVRVYLEALMYEYVVDKSNDIVRGSDKKKVSISYMITFEKDVNEFNKCRNCGANYEDDSYGICKYCGSRLINDEFVISKIECISKKNI